MLMRPSKMFSIELGICFFVVGGVLVTCGLALVAYGRSLDGGKDTGSFEAGMVTTDGEDNRSHPLPLPLLSGTSPGIVLETQPVSNDEEGNATIDTPSPQGSAADVAETRSDSEDSINDRLEGRLATEQLTKLQADFERLDEQHRHLELERRQLEDELRWQQDEAARLRMLTNADVSEDAQGYLFEQAAKKPCDKIGYQDNDTEFHFAEKPYPFTVNNERPACEEHLVARLAASVAEKLAGESFAGPLAQSVAERIEKHFAGNNATDAKRPELPSESELNALDELKKRLSKFSAILGSDENYELFKEELELKTKCTKPDVFVRAALRHAELFMENRRASNSQ